MKNNQKVTSSRYEINKNGAISPETLVKLGILVLSAVILIIIVISIDLKGEIDQTSCHNSIILRGSTRIGTLLETGTKAIPLKCKTEKYCVSDSKNPSTDACPDLESTPTSKTQNQLVDGNKMRDKTEKYLDFLAEQIYSCHKMVGEGNSNFMSSTAWSKNYCVICSRIQVDPKLASEIASGGGVSYKELYEAMAKKKTENGKSYLEEVYKMKDPALGKVFFDEVLKKQYEKSLPTQDWSEFTWDNWKIPLSGQTAIITSISEGGYGWKVVTGVTVGVVAIGAVLLAVPTMGASLVAAPSALAAVGTASTMATAVGLAIKAVPLVVKAGNTLYTLTKTGVETGGAVYTFTSATAGMDYSPPSIQVYDVETLRSLGCNSFETAP